MTESVSFEAMYAALQANTAATEKNTGILEQVLAGQAAALAKLEGGSSTRTTRKTAAEKKAEEEAAKAGAGAGGAPTGGNAGSNTDTAVPHPLLANPNGDTHKVKNKDGVEEDAPTANFRAADFSRDQVKSEFVGWLGEVSGDERKERQGFVKELGNHFGVAQIFAADGGLDEEQRKQALFYLRRKREAMKVDFSADYNFDGDPLADLTPADEPEEEDALG